MEERLKFLHNGPMFIGSIAQVINALKTCPDRIDEIIEALEESRRMGFEIRRPNASVKEEIKVIIMRLESLLNE
jgi:hypothetical protein